MNTNDIIKELKIFLNALKRFQKLIPEILEKVQIDDETRKRIEQWQH